MLILGVCTWGCGNLNLPGLDEPFQTCLIAFDFTLYDALYINWPEFKQEVLCCVELFAHVKLAGTLLFPTRPLGNMMFVVRI